MLAQIFLIVKKFWKMHKIYLSTNILDSSSYFYSICMNLEQFLNEKLLKNDVLKKILSNLEIMWKPNRLSQCFEILQKKMVGYVFTDDTKQNSS